AATPDVQIKPHIREHFRGASVVRDMSAIDRVISQKTPTDARSRWGNRVVTTMMLWLFALAFNACPLAARAAAVGNGPSEVVFLFQLVLLILFGRLLGEAFIRLGQSAVTGQLIAGILLGPSALGVLWPEARHYLFPDAEEQRAMLNAVSQVGILLL